MGNYGRIKAEKRHPIDNRRSGAMRVGWSIANGDFFHDPVVVAPVRFHSGAAMLVMPSHIHSVVVIAVAVHVVGLDHDAAGCFSRDTERRGRRNGDEGCEDELFHIYLNGIERGSTPMRRPPFRDHANVKCRP
jgi:hypothetical protein